MELYNSLIQETRELTDKLPARVWDYDPAAAWPDTGFWLSTNSNKRHNRKCENYRKTRGYPCSSSEGTPCGKCGG